MVTTELVWCGIANISPRTQAFRAWNTQLILYSMKPNQSKLLTISQKVLMLYRYIVGGRRVTVLDCSEIAARKK